MILVKGCQSFQIFVVHYIVLEKPNLLFLTPDSTTFIKIYSSSIKVLQYMVCICIINYLKLTLILLDIRVQLISVMKVFVKYVIIIYQNWTIYTYVDLSLQETTTHIIYRYPNFCEDILYVLN